jgi:site-specific recombinase XerD
MKPRKWKRLSAGIYQTTYGIRVIMNCAAGRKEDWFELGTPLDVMKKRRQEMKVELEATHPELRAGAHGRRTFNAAMKKHLDTLTIESWKSRRSELRAFAQAWGPKLIRRLTADDGKRLVKLWWDAGVPAKTISNRARSLSAMYHDLYGAEARSPLTGVSLPKVAKRRPTYVTVETIQAVEAQLRAAGDAKTHARYLVLTATGARPAHLKRATPQDVSLELRRWNIHGAKGGNAIPLPLNHDMCAAFTRFIAVGAWGDFDASEYAKQIRAAGWPADVPPYNAKHALGMDLGAKGIDLETIKDWMGHTDTNTTRIYTGVLLQKLTHASQTIDGRVGWAALFRPTTSELAGDSARSSVLDTNVGRPPTPTTKLRVVKQLPRSSPESL